ncbi:MAG: DUF504 domain-containing protein [Polyangiaceae bacterium]|nr:DUF504 domain-containing protein [Polyangiaceae bacterium]
MAKRDPQEHAGEPRHKLRTSREVYDQIRWDPRLDPSDFTIGYDTRDHGTQEMPLPSFDPEGEIPWHRIQFIRRGQTTVWDRHLRIDTLAGKRREPPPSAPGGITSKPVHTSAAALLPPETIWPPIEAIRRLHDKHVDRWMPHINLLYGFLPEAAFPEARRLIAEALSKIAPFNVTLDDVRRFHHRSSSTVWLHPQSDPPGALKSLQTALEALFPQCNEQSSVSSNGFTPHLSIAQLGHDIDAETQMAEWRRILPISFHVRAIHLISRRGDEPFVVRYEIPLNSTPNAHPA